MHSLFLDSTSGITIGLLSEDFRWIAFESIEDRRPSEHLHEKIYSLLKLHNLNWQQVRLFTIAGPGSYTGMRLSEGLADIIQWNGVNVYSFYHFDIPQLLGIESGHWITNAFKGEVFSYRWAQGVDSIELVPEVVDKTALTFKDTNRMIFENPVAIFQTALNLKLKKETYYFRSLEKEFG